MNSVCFTIAAYITMMLRVTQWLTTLHGVLTITTAPHTQVSWVAKDGDCVPAGQQLGTVCGLASSILVAERVALNFMQVCVCMCVSTCVCEYVCVCAGV